MADLRLPSSFAFMGERVHTDRDRPEVPANNLVGTVHTGGIQDNVLTSTDEESPALEH